MNQTNDDYNDFLKSVNEFNENISEIVENEDNKNTENNTGNEELKKPDDIKEKVLNDNDPHKINISAIITGEMVLRLIDMVIPRILLKTLSLFDKNFSQINPDKLKLDDEEKMIFRPLGDYIANYILSKLNPILFLSILYIYRTIIILSLEYENLSNQIKKNTMLKKRNDQQKNNHLPEAENERLAGKFFTGDNHEDKNIFMLRMEKMNKKVNEKYDDLNKRFNELYNKMDTFLENLNKKSEANEKNAVVNPLPENVSSGNTPPENVSVDKKTGKKNISEEHRKKLIENAKKAREAKRKKTENE